jgi:DNA transposition AAA+ family ATPase
MERSNTGVELNEGYVKAVERTAELARLTSRAHERKHLLVFGPEGVGKTRLLQEFARIEPLALYVPQSKSPTISCFRWSKACARNWVCAAFPPTPQP